LVEIFWINDIIIACSEIFRAFGSIPGLKWAGPPGYFIEIYPCFCEGGVDTIWGVVVFCEVPAISSKPTSASYASLDWSPVCSKSPSLTPASGESNYGSLF